MKWPCEPGTPCAAAQANRSTARTQPPRRAPPGGSAALPAITPVPPSRDAGNRTPYPAASSPSPTTTRGAAHPPRTSAPPHAPMRSPEQVDHVIAHGSRTGASTGRASLGVLVAVLRAAGAFRQPAAHRLHRRALGAELRDPRPLQHRRDRRARHLDRGRPWPLHNMSPVGQAAAAEEVNSACARSPASAPETGPRGCITSPMSPQTGPCHPRTAQVPRATRGRRGSDRWRAAPPRSRSGDRAQRRHRPRASPG